jgi:ABC-2 type transport system permease protein
MKPLASPNLKVARRLTNLQEAKHLFVDGTVAGIVLIERDFTDKIKTGKSTRLIVFLDGSNLVLANTVAKPVASIAQTLSVGIGIQKLQRMGLTRDQAMATVLPVRPELRAMYNPSYNYSLFMIPGLLMTILQQVVLLGLALSWSGEREGNTLTNLFSLSRNPFILIGAKAFPYLLIHGLVCALFIGLFFPATGISITGHWFLLLIYTAAFLLSIVTWGAWISAWVSNRLFATQVLMFVAMPSFLLSGYTWPHMAMPDFLQAISQLLPLTHFVGGLRRLCLGAADWYP